MLKNKKLLSLGICLFLLPTFLFAGCAGDSSQPKQEQTKLEQSKETTAASVSTTDSAKTKVVELTMWQQWGSGHEKEGLDKIISDFEKLNPNIKISEIPVTDNSKILTAISGGNPPDIIDLSGSMVIGEWAAKDALMPLDDFIVRNKLNKDMFIPQAWDAVTYNGKVYALPFVAFNEGFIWNKAMFKEAGLDPETPPKTIEELLQYTEKLTKVDANGKILKMGFVPNWPGSHLMSSLVWAFGGDFYDSSAKKITANDPAIIKALEWERSFYSKYGPQKVQDFVTSGGQYLTAQDLFESGKLAMAIDGEWVIRFIQENVPQLDKDLGAAYIPVSSNRQDLYGTSYIDVNPQIIPRGCKYPEEAWKFISWEVSDKNVASTFSDMVANIPQIKDAPPIGILGDARFKVFIDAAFSGKARTFPKISNSDEYQTKLTDIENQVLLDPKADIKKLLEDLNTELNSTLQK